MRDFELFARLHDDECALVSREHQNRSIGDYVLYNSYVTAECTKDKKDFYNYVSQNPNLRYKDGFGFLNGCVVDNDSELRNGAMFTTDKEKSQLCSRWNQAVPSYNKGGLIVNVDSRMKLAEDTSAIANCDILAEKDFQRFIPLPSCLANTIQNPEHIIPKYVRGGASTRNYVQDNQYLEQCGFVNNGFAWMKPQ
jgi:hypothetical protein